MGAHWLHDLDDWLRAEDLPFREYPGWLTRSRSSGGFDDVRGIVAHHTGSSTSWQNDCAYMWLNASTRPIGNVHLDRDGTITVGAAGATNTNGRGIADWHCSKGVIPISPTTMGNRMAFAIEAASNGVGEVWPRVQMDAYVRFMNMLCRRLRLDPLRDVTTHRGWAGTRKSDPFGPATGFPNLGTQTWNIPALRQYVKDASGVTPPPEPEPGGTFNYTVVSGDSWWGIADKFDVTMDALLDANNATTSTMLHPGDVIKIPGTAPAPTPPPPPPDDEGDDMRILVAKERNPDGSVGPFWVSTNGGVSRLRAAATGAPHCTDDTFLHGHAVDVRTHQLVDSWSDVQPIAAGDVTRLLGPIARSG